LARLVLACASKFFRHFSGSLLVAKKIHQIAQGKIFILQKSGLNLSMGKQGGISARWQEEDR